jgi:hypothetical protein
VPDELLRVRVKRNRFDFTRDGERITGLVVKTPYMTLEAARREEVR